jgi:phenylalanyl-tRNA synthetase beta chain
MKLSTKWLSELVAHGKTPEELAKTLLGLGFEASNIETLGPQFSGVVIGHVESIAKHPNADKLRLCKVSDGKETFDVVCGAPNVAAGQNIPFAKIGAKLPGNFKIKKSKIRGEVSMGMICSAKELDLPENGVDGIHILPEDLKLGTDFGETLGDADTVVEVDITPNRPDCLSHLGLARELGIHFGLPVTFTAPKITEPSSGPAPVPVNVQDAGMCTRYLGRTIEGVSVKPSPKWLQSRLRAIGLNPINNVADITNYVLHLTGQPLHAFDADTLKGGELNVRDAKKGETIRGLDGKDYSLGPINLVIADKEGPVAVAGVIGGEATGTTEKTTRVFLEAAHFKPGRVRNSANAIGCRTDSSYRFERGCDPAGVVAASNLAVKLILELAGGTVGPSNDTCPKPPELAPIEASPERINSILGAAYPEKKIRRILENLSNHLEGDTLYPPTHRLDLKTPWDLSEEVARHLGYAQLPKSDSPVRLPAPVRLVQREVEERLRATARALGFYEAMNYDFLSDPEFKRLYGGAYSGQPARLLNPISADWALLRPTLIGGLLRSAALNFNRGTTTLRLVELGRVFKRQGDGLKENSAMAGLLTGAFPAVHWRGAGSPPDFFAVKAMVERLLNPIPFDLDPDVTSPLFHPKAACAIVLKGGPTIGHAGLLHPELISRWDLDGDIGAFEIDLSQLATRSPKRAKFAAYPAFPSSTRDLSILLAAETPFGTVSKCLYKARIRELARVELVDIFTGKGVPDGQKSLTVRLTFSKTDGTLRDEDVQKNVDALVDKLQQELGAKLRA